MRIFQLIITLLLVVEVSLLDHGVDLDTDQPLVIAHRGSSGMLPEHTAPAYQLAVDQGADVIECDVCVTSDLQLVCLHESWMSAKTNVADVFPPDRMDTKYVDDQLRFITDYFSVDFTLAELKLIKMRQASSIRDPNHNDMYPITSMDEFIQIAKNAGRPVGIYPELKDPIWVSGLLQSNGITFEQLLVNKLAAHGYTSATDPCFVQSFNEQSIRNVSQISQLPLVKLYGTGLELTDEKLQELATFCYGIGPSKSAIVQAGLDGNVAVVTDLVERAHRAGLRVHSFTHRNEDRYLLWNYGQDPWEEYNHFVEIGLDGLFTDFPGTMRRFLNSIKNNCTGTN